MHSALSTSEACEALLDQCLRYGSPAALRGPLAASAWASPALSTLRSHHLWPQPRDRWEKSGLRPPEEPGGQIPLPPSSAGVRPLLSLNPLQKSMVVKLVRSKALRHDPGHSNASRPDSLLLCSCLLLKHLEFPTPSILIL